LDGEKDDDDEVDTRMRLDHLLTRRHMQGKRARESERRRAYNFNSRAFDYKNAIIQKNSLKRLMMRASKY